MKREYTHGDYKIIQEFITEPYLINERILVMRLYLVIKRENDGYSFYLHKYGKCLYTSENFSLKDLKQERMITDNRTFLDRTFPKLR